MPSSSNPVFQRNEGFAKQGGYATFDTETRHLEDLYQAPSATSLDTDRMTLDDVVVRTGMLFAALLVTAVPTFLMRPGFGIVIGAGLIGMVLAFAIGFMKKPNPPLMFGYALLEGVFVGGISSYYAGAFGGGIIPQAVLGTLSAFATMLVLYKTGVIRNSPKFTKILTIAGVGYLVFGLVHFAGVMFGVWDSLYSGGGPLAILLGLAGVTLASLFLVLDFDFIEQGIRNGIPKPFAWTAAFGLMVTLVWLYLEILRLIAILRGDN